MWRVAIKLLFLYLSIALIYSGYLFVIGEAKPLRCISDCYTTFHKWLSAIPRFGFGFLLLWYVLRDYIFSFSNKKEKLIKKGRYCYRQENLTEPYCCKCYEDGIISKLIQVDQKYLCPYCDYTAFYLKNHNIDEVDLAKIEDTIDKLKSESRIR